MNKVILTGRLVKDIKLETTNNGVNYARFCLAVKRKMQNTEQDCDFINCIAWRSNAENMTKYLKKGSKIALVGSMQVRTYEDNGVKKFATEIITEEVEFLNTKTETATAPKDMEEIEPSDTLPF